MRTGCRRLTSGVWDLNRPKGSGVGGRRSWPAFSSSPASGRPSKAAPGPRPAPLPPAKGPAPPPGGLMRAGSVGLPCSCKGLGGPPHPGGGCNRPGTRLQALLAPAKGSRGLEEGLAQARNHRLQIEVCKHGKHPHGLGNCPLAQQEGFQAVQQADMNAHHSPLTDTAECQNAQAQQHPLMLNMHPPGCMTGSHAPIQS